MRKSGVFGMLFVALTAVALVSSQPQTGTRLAKASRAPERNGWIYVHLEGAPAVIGYQHGYLLAPEIADAQKVIALALEQDTKKRWQFFRDAAKNVLWPRIEPEYRAELQGIAEGLNAHGVQLDVWDITALNAWLELSPYWFKWQEQQQGRTPPPELTAPDHCSAFVATGSYTKDGKIVIGHNAWTGYMEGSRWNIVFDIVPQNGHRILMDGFPGLIHSADDFGINSAGIMITETTISEFHGFDPNGIPEFVRARKAMQYSSSIDDFVRIMKEGNNGGYANNWLVGDRKTNEIADLELGLKNVNVSRTKDGYFVGSNFPVNEKLAREETDFNLNDASSSQLARRARWNQLMAAYKGKIDVAAGEKFLADHYDSYDKKEAPSERTLCGHIELSPRGMGTWQPAHAVAGAIQNKVTDSTMAARMAFTAAMGHACGLNFNAAAHLKAHPEFNWEKPYLRDLNAHPWTEFQAAGR
jgi:hypothetical protein